MNSKGGPRAHPERYAPPSWYAAGQIMRTAYEAHAEDDFAQLGNLVRDVMDDAARDRLAGNIVAQLRNGVTEPVLQRALGYLRKAGQNLADTVEKGVRGGQERCSGWTSTGHRADRQPGRHLYRHRHHRSLGAVLIFSRENAEQPRRTD